MENKEKTPEQETTNREQISSFLEKKSRILELESKADNPAAVDTLKRKIEDLDIEFPNTTKKLATTEANTILAGIICIANQTQKAPLNASTKKTIKNAIIPATFPLFLLVILSVFNAPKFLEPVSLGSILLKALLNTKAVEKDPIK
jgi:hypothetical protein